MHKTVWSRHNRFKVCPAVNLGGCCTLFPPSLLPEKQKSVIFLLQTLLFISSHSPLNQARVIFTIAQTSFIGRTLVFLQTCMFGLEESSIFFFRKEEYHYWHHCHLSIHLFIWVEFYLLCIIKYWYLKMMIWVEFWIFTLHSTIAVVYKKSNHSQQHNYTTSLCSVLNLIQPRVC